MNITSKTILASTLFTALLLGTSANADRRGDLIDYVDNSGITELAVMKKVRYETPTVDTDNFVISGRKSNFLSDYSIAPESDSMKKIRFEMQAVEKVNIILSGKK